MLYIYCSVTEVAIYISNFSSAYYPCPLAPGLTIHSPCLPGLPATTSPLTAPDIPLPNVQDLEHKRKNKKEQRRQTNVLYETNCSDVS